QKHDLVAIHISDPSESRLPEAGWVTMEDAETGELVEVNTNDPTTRKKYERAAQELQDSRRSLLRKSGLDLIEAETGRPYFMVLKKFFERRIRAR
ncbi:MAG: DUF58 domain-containing protein, partial [Terrimicrobiaceae bacterium]